MSKNQLLRKLADNQHTDLADHIRSWGLPKERKFPLDSPALVKAAAAAFDDARTDMTPAQRLMCARNICARADEEGMDVSSSTAFKYASSHLSPLFRSFIELRKHASAHAADADLDKLIDVASVFENSSDVNDRVSGLDKVASALESFDREHGLASGYDAGIPDPAFVTFSPVADVNQDMTLKIKVANFEVDPSRFENANWDALSGMLPDEVVGGLRDADDRVAVFQSLPAPEKEIIFQNLFAAGE